MQVLLTVIRRWLYRYFDNIFTRVCKYLHRPLSAETLCRSPYDRDAGCCNKPRGRQSVRRPVPPSIPHYRRLLRVYNPSSLRKSPNNSRNSRNTRPSCPLRPILAWDHDGPATFMRLFRYVSCNDTHRSPSRTVSTRLRLKGTGSRSARPLPDRVRGSLFVGVQRRTCSTI